MICECEREQDVLDAIATNRWPQRADTELQQHVAACAICADLVEVVRPLLDEAEQASEEVRVPPASVVWWRAQIRARNEAARAAARPLTIAHGAAAVTALAVAVGLVVTGWARLDGWRQSLQSFVGYVPSIGTPLPTFVAQHALGLALVAGTFLLLAPLVVYIAVSDE
jgi:hypothetical protein